MKKNKRITNKIALLFFLVFIYQNLMAQSVEKYYVNIPDALNPTLSKQNRLELLEYHKAGQGDSIDNRLGNKAYLEKLDSVHHLIVVKNTANSTFEMKLLTLDDGNRVIGIIRTVCGPICQSMVEFYDTAWSPVKLRFVMPKAIDWINNAVPYNQNVDRKWVDNVLENSFISLSFDPEGGQQIIANNNSLEFVTESDRKLISSFLSDKKLKFKLIGRNWILQP
ncbi:MAG: DUF3256 family protein [Paludibacter sp.]